MAKCIYCGGEQFGKKKIPNNKDYVKCLGCGALYISLKDVKLEVYNQINWKVYEYDGKSYC